MRGQLHLGLKSEEDIFVYLRFISRIGDESVKCQLIASFEGLRSSSVFGFKDLGTEAQSRVLEAISQRPVTRQSLELGLSLIEATPGFDLEGRRRWTVTAQKIATFIRRVIDAHASRRAFKEDLRFLEVMSTILETIWILPRELARSVALKITQGLIRDHLQMPASGPVTRRQRDLWMSALAHTGGTFYQKTKMENFLGYQKTAVVAPYLRQLTERKKASFVLRYWSGLRSGSCQSRVQYLFRAFCYAKRKDSPWVSMLQAAQKYARDSYRRSDVRVGLLFRMLRKLHQPETIVEIIKQATKLDTIMHQKDVLYIIRKYIGTQPHLAKQMIEFYPKLRLEDYPELVERLILNPTMHPEWALDYVQKHYSRFRVHRDGPDSQARIELLGRMALAYSMAPHLNPRTAFRFCHRCYTRQMKERLRPRSATVIMANAFTRAGLIRPLEAGKWISTMQVRWILTIIQSTQGTDVANRVDRIVYKWRSAVGKRALADWQAQREARYFAAKGFADYRSLTKATKRSGWPQTSIDPDIDKS